MGARIETERRDEGPGETVGRGEGVRERGGKRGVG